MKKLRLLVICVLVLSMILGIAGCGGQAIGSETDSNGSSETASNESYTIGVAVYDNNNPEVGVMKDYLMNYLGSNLSVNFIYSQNITSPEEELGFVEELHDMGINAMFSCNASYAETTVPKCDEYGIYYIAPTTNLNDETFAEVSGYEYFLGSVGPSTDDEYHTGAQLAEYFAIDDLNRENSYLIFCGSASRNDAHAERTRGLLESLASQYQIDYGQSVEDILANTSQPTTIYDNGIKITVVPGYEFLQDDAVITEQIQSGEYNTIISVLTGYQIPELCVPVEEEYGINIRVAAIDCFTEEYRMLFNETDPTGDSKINVLIGKYSSWMAPAFAIMVNNLSGHHDEFTDNGAPFRIEQCFWSAYSTEEFNDLYARSTSVMDNSRSAADVMNLLYDYNPDANFDMVVEFAQAENQDHHPVVID